MRPERQPVVFASLLQPRAGQAERHCPMASLRLSGWISAQRPRDNQGKQLPWLIVCLL